MTKTKIGRPMPTKVLIKPDGNREQTTASGILLNSDSLNKPFQGEVISVGVDLTHIIKVGEKVMYAKNTGIPIEIDNEEYLLLLDGQVLLIF